MKYCGGHYHLQCFLTLRSSPYYGHFFWPGDPTERQYIFLMENPVKAVNGHISECAHSEIPACINPFWFYSINTATHTSYVHHLSIVTIFYTALSFIFLKIIVSTFRILWNNTDLLEVQDLT